uniref:hypothetical protein n=1 Tax=Pedobacter schmidteae TaxID=2201271 RepID=UPI000EACC74B|nr:hypothetical protein [Pedobacter schmidteae]
MKEKINNLIKFGFYGFLILGIGLCLIQLVCDFISLKLFIRSLATYLILFGFFFFFKYLKNKRDVLRLLPLVLILIFVVFNIRYFYKIDMCILVVPSNYHGKVTLIINDSSSGNKIKPLDGVVLFETNNEGEFRTNSNFDIAFNRIAVAERVNGVISTKHQLQFVNKELKMHDKLSSKSYKIISGKVEKK